MVEFLKVAADIVEKGEKTIFGEPKAVVLNEIQCSRLWRNLRVVYEAFAPSLFYVTCIRSEQQKYLPLFKEFYVTVLRADAIVKKCSCEESWLEAAVLYGDCRQVFQAFSLQLQACVESFHEISEDLARTFRIPKPSIDVRIRDDEADEDFRADARNLMARLKELSSQAGIGEKETRLTSYLMEREQNDSRKFRLDLNLGCVPRFYKVDRQDIKMERNIGKGSFGVVVSEVKWLGVPCAQKEFLEGVSEGDFEKEVCALLHLNHPSIVKLLCCCCEGSRPSLVMELMPLSLSEYIQEQKKNMQPLEGSSMPFQIVAAISLMLQMALGMAYLHGQGVVHRDLKSSNILVAPWRHEGLRGEGYADLKLTDFGLAKMSVYDTMEPTRRMLGTSKWIAPEAIHVLPSQRIDWRKADAYSFGITCSEILTGEVPYSTVKNVEVPERVRGGLRPTLPPECPSYLSKFLKRCWHEIPKERPCFEEIVKTLDMFKISLLKGTEPEYAPMKAPRLLENVRNFLQKLVPQRSLNRRVQNPDPIERFETTVASNHNSLEEAVSICNRMKELLDKVRICRVQCEYLVQNYQEGVRKIKSMSEHVSNEDMLILFRSNKLQQFSGSLDRLICSMLSVEELLHACGGNNWMMTALEILTPLPQPRTYSRFGIHLWELYWNLFVIHHVMLDTKALRSKTSSQLLASVNIGSNGAKIQWSEARCRLVLRSIISYDGFVDEDDLEADADRLAEDRRTLLASLEEQFSSGAPIDGLAGYLKRRLQSTCTSIDFVSHEKYYWIDELEFEEDEYIRNESFRPVYKSKWMGESVAISILADSGADAPFCAGTQTLARVQHPNVVHLVGYGFHTNGNSASGCSVMELVEEDLGSLIERNTRLYNGAPFPLMISVDILLQIVEAMVHVHKCGELHRNLGPSNVLMHPKSASTSSREDINVYYLVKLTGFLRDGVVTKMPGSSDVLYDSSVRARGYMAPAMRNFPKEEYTQATDVWSFGWIAHDVLLGPCILGWERNHPLLPDWCPQGLKELMTKCWGTTPQGRPSFEQIRKELMTIKYKEVVSSSS